MTDDVQVRGRGVEATLLAAILKRGALYEECREIVAPEDFSWTLYGDAWRAAETLHADGLTIDPVTVADAMERAGTLADFQMHTTAQFTARAALFELRRADIRPEMALSYANSVKDYSASRQMLREMQQGASWCLAGSRKAADIQADMISRLASISPPGGGVLDTRDLFAVGEAEYQNILTARDSDGRHIIPTGFPSLDKMLGGFEAPDLTIIAALPGVGKTAFMLSLMLRMSDARPNLRILTHSLEMSAEQLYRRMVSAKTSINYAAQKTGRLTYSQWDEYEQARRALAANKNILVNDKAGVQVGYVRGEIRRTQPDIVLIDYLQLMTSPTKSLKRHEQVAEITRDIKNLSKTVGVPIVALAQLNRESIKSERPRLQNLAESAELERAADNVIFLHRKEENDTKIEIIIAKQRNGPTGIVNFNFDPQRMIFAEW